MSTPSIALKRTDPGGADADDRRTPDQFKPWHFFVLVSLLSATAAVIMARESTPEHLVLISLTVGAAGFAAAALYRTLAPLVSNDTAATVEPLTEGMRTVLEREKMLTLRAIKELEFDRAMGKLSAADFDEMADRLRTRAISLMKQLDAGGSAYRELIERELQGRLRRRPASSVQAPADEPHAAGSARPPAAVGRALCRCGTANDPDASFCKRCGSRLAESAQA